MPGDLEVLDNVQRVRRRLAEVGPDQVRADGDFDRVAVPYDDGDVLRDVLVAERPRVVIEIGLAYGSSALAIAEALVSVGADGAQHVIIDAFQDHFHDAGWKAIVTAGLTDRCALLRERSQLALPRLVAAGFVADAAFVDGSHIFHNVFVDLAFLRELVRPGGLVILDDCDWPSVATAVRYFEINTGWQPEPIERDTRLRAYRLPDTRVEPSFETFEPFGHNTARGSPRGVGGRVGGGVDRDGSEGHRLGVRPVPRRPLRGHRPGPLADAPAEASPSDAQAAGIAAVGDGAGRADRQGRRP